MSGIRLHTVLLPMFLAYGATLFIIIGAGADQSKSVLIGKLLLGCLLLGAYPAYLLRNSPTRFVPAGGMRWDMVAFAMAAGALLLFGLKYAVQLLQVPDPPRLLSYFGRFDPQSPEFFVILLLVIGYVIAEEIYFRGVLYPYLKPRLGTAAAATLASFLFSIAHLIFFVPYLVTLAALSLLSIFLFERTGTLFYGIVTHGTLNVLSLILLSDLGSMVQIPAATATFTLFVCVVAGGMYLFVDRKRATST